jgi:cytochrome P450
VLDRVTGLDSFDLVDAYANPLSAVITLDFMGLPLDNWERYMRAIHELIYVDRESAEFAWVNADLGLIQEDMAPQLRAHPRDDFTSYLRWAASGLSGESAA